MSSNLEIYEVLKKRINEIIHNFSFDQDQTIMPTPQQQDMTRAMIFLCHAEFEDYIEQLATNLLVYGEEKWEKCNLANKNIAALFLEHDKINKNISIDTKVKKVFCDYKEVIKKNHGIKQDNLKKLYKPLGYLIEDFDQTFISELDSFGVRRGKVAHCSASSSVIEILDFNTEKEKIERILDELKNFQEVLLSDEKNSL